MTWLSLLALYICFLDVYHEYMYIAHIAYIQGELHWMASLWKLYIAIIHVLQPYLYSDS